MNNTIKTRLQVFLAKIAGKDVDVATLTPPVAANLEEKLMLDIADRIDAIESGGGGGGGSDVLVVTYTDNAGTVTSDKTLAEIYAAAKAGKIVVAVQASENNSAYYYLGALNEENGAPLSVEFVGLCTDGISTLYLASIYHSASVGSDPESITITSGDITFTPVT